MLVNMTQMLKEASLTDRIVPGFNVFGYEDAQVVIEVAEKLGAPVLLMTNRDAAEFMDLKYFGALYQAMGRETEVPVCIHLDHGKCKEDVIKAIQAGYTSVMYDGSALSIEENIKNSKLISEMCSTVNVSLEVEVGCVAYHEPHIQVAERLTETEEVIMMAKEVKAAGIAVAVGNVHRMREKKAVIDFERLSRIDNAVQVPLVIHGSSGIPDEQVVKIRSYGVGKMNLGTSVRQAFGYAMRDYCKENPEVFDRIQLMKMPMQSMRHVIEEKYRLLGW